MGPPTYYIGTSTLSIFNHGINIVVRILFNGVAEIVETEKIDNLTYEHELLGHDDSLREPRLW